tara:strand:- start:7951 stop:9174 length:1224 start_codon:yes stop_codon:yes gene_type:complete
MPSHNITETGALSGIKDDDEKKRTRTVPVYEYQGQTPDLGGKKLQDVYGRGSLPMFQWVRRIQIGEREIDLEDDFDAKMQRDYEAHVSKFGVPEGLPSPQELLQKASSGLGQTIGAPIGGAIGASLVSDAVTGSDAFASLPIVGGLAGKGSLDFGTDQFFMGGKPLGLPGQSLDQISQNIISSRGLTPAQAQAQGLTPLGLEQAGARLGANILQKQGVKPLEILKDRTQLGIAGGQAVGNFAVQLIAGEDPASAARKAGASALASHLAKSIFTPILGPIGGGIAGFIGGALGGRVICNELMKQGFMSKEDVILDYRFTRDYLTPQHVNGYHLWAVWVVKQMRKGRMIGFWKYIAQSRANEIAYIYGRRDKPDYVGKVVRTIGEPVCWFFGLFCKKTDWSTLYNEKEI